MLKTRPEFLSQTDIEAIHQTSMRLLSEVGIHFPSPAALQVFASHAVRLDGERVYLTEKQVLDAIRNVPASFTLQAPNPARALQIGGGQPVFAPGYGAPILVDAEHGKRTPTLADYHNLVRLAQALPNMDLSGHLMVEPQDIPSQDAHLQMLLAHMLYSDKPYIGSSEGSAGAQHTFAMSEILFGGKLTAPVTIGLINPLSPLGYGSEMIEALMAYAAYGQPLIIAALVMAGSTGPITAAGVLAMQNAELLAGITLAQLVRPGVPCLYGSTSTNIDMASGGLAIGSPELSLLLSAHAQIGRFYGLPLRGGGALTDASLADAQAGFESMFSLLTSVNSGVDFILHAGGILSSYLAFSLEKLVIDDELCGMLRRYLRGIEVNPETLAFEVIQHVGPGGHFLHEDHTFDRCRTEFWGPKLVDRSGLDAFWEGEQADTLERARRRWMSLLAAHQDPMLDDSRRHDLETYVAAQSSKGRL